jgi:hypothetical protein
MAFLLKNEESGKYVYGGSNPYDPRMRVFAGTPGNMEQLTVTKHYFEQSTRRTIVLLEGGGAVIIPQRGRPTFNGQPFSRAPMDMTSEKIKSLGIPGTEHVIASLAKAEAAVFAERENMRRPSEPPAEAKPPGQMGYTGAFNRAAPPVPMTPKEVAPTQEELARSIIATTPAAAPGINVTIYDENGIASAMVLGGGGTMEKISVKAIPGDFSKVKLKSADAPEGYVMSTSDAKQLVRHVNGPDVQNLLGMLTLIEAGVRNAPQPDKPASPVSSIVAPGHAGVASPGMKASENLPPGYPDVAARDKYFQNLAKWERGEGSQPEVPEAMKAAPQDMSKQPSASPAPPAPAAVPVNIAPSPQMQELVRTLGGQGKNIIFSADKASALEQQVLMSSPAMLDSLKAGGVKHIFASGYRQDMQDFSTALWDATRAGDPKQLNLAKDSFVRTMELQREPDPLNLRDNAVPPGQEGNLYRRTADMIVEAAKRGIQVHFTDEADLRGLQQVARDKLDPAATALRNRQRNDHESEFIRLTAQGERFAVVTGDRRMREGNSLIRQIDDTMHIALSPAPEADYNYSMKDMRLEDMKASRQPVPSAPQSAVSSSFSV